MAVMLATNMDNFSAEYSGVIWVTLLMVAVYYAIMTYGMVVKLRLVKRCKEAGQRFDRYGGQYPELLASDRMQLNTLEHLPLFLTLLWLNALCVGAQSATLWGGLYVLLRALYPFFLGARLRALPSRIFLITAPSYLVLLVLGVQVGISLL